MLNVTHFSADAAKHAAAAHYAAGRFVDALAAFETAAKLDPASPAARHNVGLALFALKRFDEALPHFQEALDREPRLAIAWNSLAAAQLETGRAPAAVTTLRRALALHPDHTGMHSFLLCALAHAGAPWPEIVAESAAFAHRFPAVPRPPIAPLHDRPLRLGFVSADLRDHAVAWFLEPLLQQLRPPNIETICYSHVLSPDATTARLRAAAGHWRDIAPLDDQRAADLIAADRIDILVDLMGHTAGNRLPLFARRPAPVQVSWLGYAGPTPLAAIDARLSDPVLDPTPGDSADPILTLPLFAVYRPPQNLPELPATRDPARPLTLACFGNPIKWSAPFLAACDRILQRLANARLLLILPGLAPAAIARIRAHFAPQTAARLDFRDALTFPDYLALHNQVDLILDTFPLSGHTVSCHALAMGAPIVTLAGATPWQRLTTSVLTVLKKPDWIAATPDEYIDRAVALTENLPDRRTLRHEFLHAPLTDAAAFAGHFLHALRTLHARLSA